MTDNTRMMFQSLNQLRNSIEGSTQFKNSMTLDQSRQAHNMSVTVEGSRDMNDSKQLIPGRKRSMPPANVVIPLLDLSKLQPS